MSKNPYVFLSKTFMSFCPKKIGNYILFAPLLLTPRPCRGGAGVGSAFLPAYNIFHVPLSSSLISLTPPLSPRPHPYPLSKGRGGLQGRGNSAYSIFLNPIPFLGLHIVPQQKRKAEPAFPIISFMSLCLKPLCLFVQNLYVFLSKTFMSFCLKTFMSFCLKPYVFMSPKTFMSFCPKSKSPKSP